eukprot:UN0161
MNDSRYTHDEKLRLIDSGFCVLLEDYTLLNAWFQLGLGLGQLIRDSPLVQESIRLLVSIFQQSCIQSIMHLEVASDSFCFLLYSSWLLVFILYIFELFFSFINLYCWKGLHFS